MGKLANLLDKKREKTPRSLICAHILIFGMAILATAFLFALIVIFTPQFTKMFKTKNMALPALSVYWLQLSQLAMNFWYIAVPLVGVPLIIKEFIFKIHTRLMLNAAFLGTVLLLTVAGLGALFLPLTRIF